MHPIERLRYVARAGGAPPSSLVAEAASALAGLAGDAAALVTAGRRLVERHPQVGPMWWLVSRVLNSPHPGPAAWSAIGELDEDPTSERLAAELGESAAVVVLGWPELAGSALMRRGDLAVMLVDPAGEAQGLARRLRGAGSDVVEVPLAGLAQAVAAAEVVLLEALALGGEGAVVASGGWAAAAVARSAGASTWLVAGQGRGLPGLAWEALLGRLEAELTEPWDRDFEVLPLELVDRVAGPGGVGPVGEALAGCTWQVAAELLVPVGVPGG